MAPRNSANQTVVEMGFSTSKLEEAKTALVDVKRGIERAVPAAINKTLAKARTQFLKSMTTHFTIKRKNLAQRTFVKKATVDNPSGFLRIMGRPIGLINFKTKDTRRKTGWGTKVSGKGVQALVAKGEAPLVLPRAFIVQGKFGNTHVFMRDVFGGKIGTRKGRFPISTQFSQRLYDLYHEGPIKAEVEGVIATESDRQLDSQIDRFLKVRK